jgi:asparagine synthase (glutamine-hydrolysing)
MCGIAGEYAFDNQQIDADSAAPMLRSLAHRGPDGGGIYSDASRRALLLHARLAIVDVAGGAQPLSNESGSIWAVVNGELYGYEEERRALEERGHRFATQSDSELVVHLYEEHAEDFVQRLRGEFAIALYDERRRALLLARDRFGIKPLYYARRAASILFASEIKAIFAHARGPRAMDLDAVRRVFSGILLPAGSTFEGISAVRPAHVLRVCQEGVTERRYWKLRFAGVDVDARTLDDRREADIVAEFRALLEDAVRIRLRADVPVGAYLSGGVDSTAVVALMKARLQCPLKVFTVGFDNSDFDESAMARRTAQDEGLDHVLVRIRKGELAEHFVRSLWHSEMPVANSHGVAKMCLSRAAREHVKVVLTGEGADEAFAGYDAFIHQELLEDAHRRPGAPDALRAARSFRSAQGMLSGAALESSYRDYDSVVARFGAYPYQALRAVGYGPKVGALFSLATRQRTRYVDPIADLAAAVGRFDGITSIAASQAISFETDLPGYILNVLGDRQEMASSVEGRLPMLDHPLVEFAARLPTRMKLREGQGKYILRRAVADIVPPTIAARSKHAFVAPTAETLGLTAGRDLGERYLSREVTRRIGIFDPTLIWMALRAISILPRRTHLYALTETALTMALSVHVLHDIFVDRFRAAADELGDTRYGSRALSVATERLHAAARRVVITWNDALGGHDPDLLKRDMASGSVSNFTISERGTHE